MDVKIILKNHLNKSKWTCVIRFSVSTISSFSSIENKHDAYRCKDCMKTFCEFLRECAMKMISFKKRNWSY